MPPDKLTPNWLIPIEGSRVATLRYDVVQVGNGFLWMTINVYLTHVGPTNGWLWNSGAAIYGPYCGVLLCCDRVLESLDLVVGTPETGALALSSQTCFRRAFRRRGNYIITILHEIVFFKKGRVSHACTQPQNRSVMLLCST